MSTSSEIARLIIDQSQIIKSNNDAYIDKPTSAAWKGEKDARICVIASDMAALESSKDPLLLNNLLKALKVDAADICQIDYSSSEIKSWRHIKENISAEFVLIFGLKPMDLGMQIIAYPNKWFPFSERHFIFTSALSDMAAKDELKLPFWKAIKPVFQPNG